VRVRCDRASFAKSNAAETRFIDPLVHEIAAHGVRAFLAQSLIIGVRAFAVRMTFDADGVCHGFEILCGSIERWGGVFTRFGSIKIKEDIRPDAQSLFTLLDAKLSSFRTLRCDAQHVTPLLVNEENPCGFLDGVRAMNPVRILDASAAVKERQFDLLIRSLTSIKGDLREQLALLYVNGKIIGTFLSTAGERSANHSVRADWSRSHDGS
jgi:hypothetical protein